MALQSFLSLGLGGLTCNSH